MKPPYFFLLSLMLTAMLWLSSHFYHSAIGMDHDRFRAQDILHTYYRIHTTGYGSLWFGYGSNSRALTSSKPFERFDPAAVFFQKPRHPHTPQSHWNSMGFWYINSQEPSDTFWVGVPAWLPFFLVLATLLIKQRIIRALSVKS